MRLIGIVIALYAAAVSFPAESKKPITHEALWLLKQVGAPIASPDGRWVVVPVSEPAYDEKDERADLWIVPTDGSAEPRRLTTARGRESSPAWSPDSKQLAFSAKREGDEAAQIYLLDLAGGEARRLTEMPSAAVRPRWSPDGKWVHFQGSAYRGARDVAENKRFTEERKKAKSKVRIYDHFPTRVWDKWLDDIQTRLFVTAADGSGPVRDLLAGSKLAESPGFRGAGDEGANDSLQAEWAPDSQSIVFTATVDFHRAAYQSPLFQLYHVSVEGGEPQRLTPEDASYSDALFAPDGKQLCFLRSAYKGKIYALKKLVRAAWPWSGDIQAIAQDFDRSIQDFDFTPDSQTVYFSAENAGHIQLWSAPVAGGEPRIAFNVTEGVWIGPQIPRKAEKPMIIANWESATKPAEVYRVELQPKQRTRLTSFNADKAQEIDWAPLREFWFTNKQGRAIHSFMALPPGFDETKKYPLFVLIHGGHANMWRDSITRRWNYHLLAQPGYVVLLTDYVGSTGYGEKFTLSILGDPLRGPAQDINDAADEAIRRFPFIDGTRQAAGGASYGGHLANWIEGTTTRYKCLISHAGLASLYAQWTTSDYIYHRELMMGGPSWEKWDAWLNNSPAKYAADFKTPMLLSIGETDYRVPLNNVIEMWSLLQRQQVPSRLLVWPDENHWILKGENSRVFYREVHAWLDRWLNESPPTH